MYLDAVDYCISCCTELLYFARKYFIFYQAKFFPTSIPPDLLTIRGNPAASVFLMYFNEISKMRCRFQTFAFLGAFALAALNELSSKALAQIPLSSHLKLAVGSLPPQETSEALVISRLKMLHSDMKKARLEKNSYFYGESGANEFYSRKRKHHPILMIALLLTSALAVSFLVMQCYKHLTAANHSGRRLAVGGEDSDSDCSSGDEDNDDEENKKHQDDQPHEGSTSAPGQDVIIDMGDDGTPTQRPRRGLAKRIRDVLGSISRLLFRQPIPEEPLEEVVVQQPQGRVHTALSPPELTMRLFAGHMGTALIFAGLVSNLAFAPAVATGIAAFFIFMLGLEEFIHGATGGRFQATEWMLQRILTRRPPGPNARLSMALTFRFGFLFVFLGMQPMVNSIYSMVVDGTFDTSTWLPLVGAIFQLLTGIDQLLYGGTNGVIDLAFPFTRDPPSGYYDIRPGDPLPRPLGLWENEFPRGRRPGEGEDPGEGTSGTQGLEALRSRARRAAVTSLTSSQSSTAPTEESSSQDTRGATSASSSDAAMDDESDRKADRKGEGKGKKKKYKDDEDDNEGSHEPKL